MPRDSALLCSRVLQEAFNTAKMHARDYRSRTRSDLIRTHIGPDTLEEAVQSFMNRNVDLYDLSYMVQVCIASHCAHRALTLLSSEL